MHGPAACEPEIDLPLESLLRLSRRGPQARSRAEALALRGDWRSRLLALSALGRWVREDRWAWRGAPWTALWHLPWVRRLYPGLGPRGARVRGTLSNGLSDRVWIVRTAAALALGECRDSSASPALRALLADPSRAVRLAAAAALGACGETHGVAVAAQAESAPERIGDTADTVEWLTLLSAAHAPLLAPWASAWGVSSPADAAAWARFLAGPAQEPAPDSRDAEVLRYAQEKDTHYHFTKPFTPVNREVGTRLLHSFLVVAEHLNAPQEALVLDLGGGPAWVSELLAKFGFRPVTLDLAPALLRIGRDRFRREHLPARLVCADMTTLPFRSGSFEAVVVIDALHHVPDAAAVVREAFRVLAPGGQFLLAEPGEGHAETDASRREMREHGVREGEVHLFEAVEWAQAAGFDRVDVIPHHVPAATLSPTELRRAQGRGLHAWGVRLHDRPVRFDEYLLQALLAHPILVCSKGARTCDSRRPRRLRAVLEPALLRQGSSLHGEVLVENQGDTLWLCGSGDRPGTVRLGLQLMSAERKLLLQDFARAPLEADVPPGGRARLRVEAHLPDPEEPYVIKLDLVDEHICWFEDRGSVPRYVAV